MMHLNKHIDIFLPIKEFLYVIPVTVEGIQLTALIDTGSTLTIIASKTAKRLGFSQLTPPRQAIARSMTGHTLSFQGCKNVKMKIGDAEFHHEVHIAPDITSIGYDLILGTDLLKHMPPFTINYRNGTATFNNKTLPLGTPTPLRKVTLINGTYVHPQMQVTALGKLKDFQAGEVGKPFVLEPNEQCLQNSGLAFGRVLATPSNAGLMPVMLLNAGYAPVYLYPNTTVAIASTVVGQYIPADPVGTSEGNNVNLLRLVDVSDKRKPAEFYSPIELSSVTPKSKIIGQESPVLDKVFAVDDNENYEHLEEVVIPEDNLTEMQKKELMNLLKEYSDRFSKHQYDLGKAKGCEHVIDIGNAASVKARPYRIPIAQRPIVDQHIKDMTDAGIIRPSKGPFSSPIILVKKSDQTYRFVVDYRKLNNITVVDNFPIPRPDETIDQLVNVKYLSTLDLSAGFWQIPVAEESIEKTAFVVHGGLFEFLRLPFGLCNSPSTFQRHMSEVTRGLPEVLCYIDDLIVFSKTWEEHLQNLRTSFDRLRQYDLKLKPKKCTFAASEVLYLGHVISQDGIRPELRRIEAVRNFPVPKDVKAIRSFCGLAGYYRKFIANFGSIAAPLYQLTKKNVKFIWSTEQQQAFDTLRKKLCEAPLLILPDYSKKFTLFCDASKLGIGSVLCQEKDGEMHPVAYYSRLLTQCEIKYSTIEKECLSIVDSIKTHRASLWGRQFKIVTDHSPLQFLLPKNNNDTTGRVARWALKLQEYDFTIEHRAGRAHANADCLSRYIATDEDDVCYCRRLCINNRKSNYTWVLQTKNDDTPTVKSGAPEESDDLGDRQRKDAQLSLIIDYLENGTLPGEDDEAFKQYATNYQLGPDGCLYKVELNSDTKRKKKHRLVIPKDLQTEILMAMHDDPWAGHLGIYKTLQRISRRYYWENMTNMIKEWVQACTICGARKELIPRCRELLTSIVTLQPFDLVAMDCLGPLPLTEDGHRHVLILVDGFTKWVELYAVQTLTSKELAQVFVEKFITHHGSPLQLLSDQAPSFASSLYREINELLRVRKIYSTAYRPQGNGQAERTVQTVKKILSCYLNDTSKDWDRFLCYVKFAINSSTNESTRESPYYLLYGRDPRLPIEAALTPRRQITYRDIDSYVDEVRENLQDAWKYAKMNLQKAQNKQKHYHDMKTHQIEYKIGQRVWITTPYVPIGKSRKFYRKYLGPFRIISILRPHVKIIPVSRPNSKPRTVHFERLKPYCAEIHVPDPAGEQLDLYDEFEPDSTNVDYGNSDEETEGDENNKFPPDTVPQITVTPPEDST
ncbi:MAG: DDE-type integrase/transposase/recombinase, partial [Gammaproteobacteria bacterium]|nr:DDE-type integrase/transposase/recombinase [Gammaproteobacteria bacterium]